MFPRYIFQPGYFEVTFLKRLFSSAANPPFKGTVLLIILSACSICGCDHKNESSKKSDVEALTESFELEERFKIEVLASEPLIGDPVDMEIDEYGRLYVVEMPGYPLDKSGTGKIKLLADTDGDGRMDQATDFADKLILPNSIMRWKKGVLVTDAPNVLYFEDTDNDGRADVRDTVLTGFALSNPQHNLNSPMLGIDNWIYLAHEGAVSTETYAKEFGDPGTEVYFTNSPGSPRLGKNSNGRAVRFNPDKRLLEELSSHTQFGHTFDQWGHYFLVGNANHIYQEMIAERYLKRNPALLLSDATQSNSDHGNAAEVFPITLNPQHQLLTDIGVITSACGLTAYTGGAFPAPYNEDVTFVAEPVSNLVHVDKLINNGTTFTASRLRESKEFLASADPRFRPVNLYIGPDGALYVVDYYRQIIEHPEWMGKEVIESGDLYNEADKGRIYRISPKNSQPANWTKGLTLGDATDEELVDRLSEPNSWWRHNAQRLLIDRKSKHSIALLNTMVTIDNPMGRLHALWTLEGLGKLTAQQIETAFSDKEPGIRENAIKLAEAHLHDSPHLADALVAMKSDADPKVRYQLLCTLGYINSRAAETARQELLFQDISDKWVQIAALSAEADPMLLLEVVMEKFQEHVPAYSILTQRLASMVAYKGNNTIIGNVVKSATPDESDKQSIIYAALLEGLAQGLQTSKKRLLLSTHTQETLVSTFFESPSQQVRKAALHLLKSGEISNRSSISMGIRKALDLATDQHQPEDKRTDCIDFLSIQNPAKYADLLKKFITPQEPLSVQLAALRSLSAIPNTTISNYLLHTWPTLTPELQDAAINTFLTTDDRITILINAIEARKISPSSISWPRRVRLMAQKNIVLRERARAIFTTSSETEVNERYQSALKLNGNVENGSAVFQQRCATCHQLRGKSGISIGPDLGTIHNWSASAIMANILSPNLSISSGYDLWFVELTNGESMQGIIASETPGAITLRNTGMADRTINRKDIHSLKTMNMSVMPSGSDLQVTEQQMADLLAFLKQNK